MFTAPMDETGLPKIPALKPHRLRLGPLSVTVVLDVLRASKRAKTVTRCSGVKLGIGARSVFVRVPTGKTYEHPTRYTPEYLQDMHALGNAVPMPLGGTWFVDPEDFTFWLYERARRPTLAECIEAAGAGFLKG